MKKNPYFKVLPRFWQRSAALAFPLLLAFLMLGVGSAWAGNVVVSWNVPGTYTWVCPPGVNSIKAECWGGGGAGGSARDTSTVVSVAGGGGGGGGYARVNTLTVSPGKSYTITIPAQAAGPTGSFSAAAANAGSAVSFAGDSVTVTANGGSGGLSAVGGGSSTGQNGGAGATTTTSDQSFAGGFGSKGNASGTTGNGGGSGAGASDTATGNNANATSTATTGVTAAGTTSGSDSLHNGGAGATGPTQTTGTQSGGADGTTPGGGGSGAAMKVLSNGNVQGGKGGAGQIVITYTGVEKLNNTTALNAGGSWWGGSVPGSSGLAVFDSVLATAGNASSLTLGGDTALGNINVVNPAGPVTIASGNTLTLNGGILMSNATVDFTINCALALGADSTENLASGRTLTLGGTVSGAHNLTVQGSGKVTLSGNNTSANSGYSGTTTVSGGVLNLNNLNAIANSSSVTVASGGTLQFPAGGTYATPGITISGTGSSAVAANSGALWFGQGGSYSSVLNSAITLGTGGATIASYGNTMNQTLGGGISGTGPLTIASQGGATDLHLWTIGTTASTYSGNTIINNNNGLNDITVQLGVDNALPTATSLNLTGNTTTTTAFTTLDLNGHPQTLAGLTDTGGSASGTGHTFGKRVINSSSTLATLTLTNSGSDTYGTTGTSVTAGTIGGTTAGGSAANNLALTMSGSGTLTLNGANTYTGVTTISSGTLALGSSGSLAAGSSISIAAGATFDVSAQTTYTLGSSAALTASGTGTGSSTQATIKGGTTVSLGAQAVTLTWGGGTSGTDTTHPCLVVSQGALTLNNNAFTINGSQLGIGTYTLISVTGGIINEAGSPSYSLSGTAVANNTAYTYSLAKNSGSMVLTVAAKTYTVTFNNNGGSGTMTAQTANYNTATALTANSFTRTGYTFAGWNTATNGTGTAYADGASYPFTASTTLYAQWTINSYTLTYNRGANGTITGSTNQLVTYLTSGTAVTAVANAGYTFSGWSDGVATATRTDVALIGGTNVTAQYTTNSYNLVYNANDGGAISGNASQSVPYLTSGGVVTAVASNGYAFTGWSDGIITSNRTDIALIGGTNVTASFVTTCTSPTIVGGISPASVTATVGDQVVLTVTNVTGTAPFSYQWLSNAVAIANATNSSYTNLSVLVTDAGNYQVVITNDCGAITSSVAVVTVNPQTPLISTLPTSATITYGQALGAATLSGGLVTNAAGATIAGSFAYNTPASIPNAGTASQAVTFKPNDTNNYNSVSTTVSVTVNPALLGVTANDASKTYNGAGYTGGNGVTYAGFVNGETNTALTGTLTYGGTSQGATNAGSYTIIPSGLTSTNYAISYTNGTLTVNPAGTAVTAVASANPSGFNASVAFTATLPADATGNVVFASASGAFSTNSLTAGSATSLAITNLPRGTNVITVAYLGAGNYLGSTNALNQIVTNHPPVASNVTYSRNAAVSTFKVLVSDLLTNATDVDGDSLTLVAVGTSTNGIMPLISGGWVLYTNTNPVADQFSYTVTDGYGGTNTATVSIAIDSTPLFGQSEVASTTGGTATLNFAGIPGYSYSVARSVDLSSWTVIWTTNAPAGGTFQYIDTTAPSPAAYYRLQFNP